MKLELKNCPFCGKSAIVVNAHNNLFSIRCSDFRDCGTMIGVWNTPRRAIKAWNTRINDTGLEE